MTATRSEMIRRPRDPGRDPNEEAWFHDVPPGPLASKKSEPPCRSGFCVPVADEVESARLLANESRDELHRAGLDDQAIDELADDFVAEDRGEETEEFVAWARYTDWVRHRWAREPTHEGAVAS